MNKSKPVCQELTTWLKANLGKHCLAPLTSTDSRCLDAAVHVAQLWSYEEYPRDLALAFGATVKRMQHSTMYLAYHAIAMVSDWHLRERLWQASGLPTDLGSFPCCSGEPRTLEVAA